jgi:hypothetical protein
VLLGRLSSGSSQGSALLGLLRGHFAMVCSAQHLKATVTVVIRVEMVMAPGPVPATVPRGLVIHLAVTTFGIALWSFAEVLCASLGGCSRKPPDVIALPGASATVGTPRAAA